MIIAQVYNLKFNHYSPQYVKTISWIPVPTLVMGIKQVIGCYPYINILANVVVGAGIQVPGALGFSEVLVSQLIPAAA